MNTTIITDCRDANTIARLSARTGSLLNSSVTVVGVGNFAEIETAAILVDTLDAYEDREGAILANAAPRHGKAKKWENGTPFGYFRYKNIIVVTTIDGYTLSLVKKLRLINSFEVFDIPTVLESAKQQGLLTDDATIERITNSQFRSFDFQPRVADWLQNNINLISKTYSIDAIADIDAAITWIDNFGNCKTNILPEEVDFVTGKEIQTKFGLIPCYNKMKDVPSGEKALVIGSSGIGDKRFVELIVQGESAAEALGLAVGDKVVD